MNRSNRTANRPRQNQQRQSYQNKQQLPQSPQQQFPVHQQPTQVEIQDPLADQQQQQEQHQQLQQKLQNLKNQIQAQEAATIAQQQQAKLEEINNDDNSSIDMSVSEENRKMQFKMIFSTRKKSSVRAKEKRLRQNRQLRKVILPKNALMALNEIKGLTVGDFIINSNQNGGFTAIVTVDNKQYEGRGISKVSAKNNACEKALRDFFIEKMRQKPINPKAQQKTVPDVTTNEEEVPMETNEKCEESGNEEKKSEDGIEDIPMVNLASFAIYKLFTEWENEGFIIPELHPSIAGTAAEAVAPEKPIPVKKELPLNWEQMHPTALLCIMRPGLTYVDFGTVGERADISHRISVTVDGEQYVGVGRSKKIARRNTAAMVCNTLFGTNFTKVESAEQMANLQIN